MKAVSKSTQSLIIKCIMYRSCKHLDDHEAWMHLSMVKNVVEGEHVTFSR